MEGIMIGSSNIVNPKLVAKQDSTSTIKIKARTPMAMEMMLDTAVTALERLSPHLKIRDERVNKNKSRRDEVIISRPIRAITGLGKINGAPVEGKAITDPKWKSGSMINATMQTNTPLGGIDDTKMTQESMTKALEFVKQGQKLDVTA